MLDLSGKVAFVSGAGSVGEGWGNGKATAVLMARQGAHVFGTDINPVALAETAAIMASEGLSFAGRVTNSEEANAFLKRPYRDGWVLNG
jgi:NAD(P)-dependent dehydrogenase (short-subunit alcohol dehydrogenase family)